MKNLKRMSQYFLRNTFKNNNLKSDDTRRSFRFDIRIEQQGTPTLVTTNDRREVFV